MASEGTNSGLRVLIVRAGAMGDILHALPAVTAWRERHPEAEIGWAVEPHWAPLLANRAVIDRVHFARTREWKQRPFMLSTLGSIRALRAELRRERYDVCVDLQGSIRSAVIGRMSGAGRLIGADRPREAPARLLYRERVSLQAEHVIEQACELMAAIDSLGAGAPGAGALGPRPVRLAVDDSAEAWAADLIANDARPFVLLVPSAGWGAKRWPAEQFRKLAQAFLGAGLRVLVNASSAVHPTALAVARETTAEIVPCSLAELIALTRRAALVVGGDTGPTHLAAALGRPVLALFGPTDPARNGPFFPVEGRRAQVEVVRSEQSRTDHRRLEEAEAGLASIPAERVIEQAFGMLAAAGQAHHAGLPGARGTDG